MSSPAPAIVPNRRVSLESIAKEMGVSIATISRALNGKPGISDEMRAKVRARLTQRAYHRREPREPRKSRSRLHTVAFVVSDDLFEKIHQGDDFYGRHLIAVQRAISDAGFYPLLIGYNQDLNEDGMLRCVAEKRAQAIIGESWSSDLTDRIAKEVPVVLFNRIAPNWNVDTVSTDIHVAAQVQLEHLYDLGHRRMAVFRVTPPISGWEDNCFWQQYYTFTQTRGLPLLSEAIGPIRFGKNEHHEAIRRFVDRLLELRERPTAILTHDAYAEHLLEALKERGIAVPQAMSLIGFNAIKESADLSVPLTTYRQDFDALAHEAMHLVLDRFNRPAAPPRLLRIRGSMVLRASTMPPP